MTPQQLHQHIHQQIRIMQTALNTLTNKPPKPPTIIRTAGNPQ